MSNMNEYRRKELIAYIAEHYDGVQSRFALAAGYDRGRINQMVNPNGGGFGEGAAENLEVALKLGSGAIFKSRLTPKQGDNFDSNTPHKKQPPRAGKVPLISWVNAGPFCNVEDPYAVGDAEEWLNCPVPHGPRTYALLVRGESMTAPPGMSPSYPDGYIIFIDPDQAYQHKDCCVVRKVDSDEATFKQILIEADGLYIKPLNPNWPTGIEKLNDNVQYCGKAILGMYIPK